MAVRDKDGRLPVDVSASDGQGSGAMAPWCGEVLVTSTELEERRNASECGGGEGRVVPLTKVAAALARWLCILLPPPSSCVSVPRCNALNLFTLAH